MGPLNWALLDVQAKLRAEGDAINECTKAYLASRTAIRVRILYLLCFLVFSLWGRASAPSGCSPRVSGRLLSSRLGTLIGEFQVPTFFSEILMQDYHNLRVTSFNANVEELAKRTADLNQS